MTIIMFDCVLFFFAQRRQWLQEAIASMSGGDPVKAMLQNVEILLKPSENDETDIVAKELALEDLQLHTEDLDLANGTALFFAGLYGIKKKPLDIILEGIEKDESS